MRKSTIAMVCLCLFYTYWILGGAPPRMTKLPDYDENIGKTVLIHRSAGEFVLHESWFFGKKSGDSYFYSSPPYPKGEAPPQLYKITAEYRNVSYGATPWFGGAYNKYLLKPIHSTPKKRLFFSLTKDCNEQPNRIDEETGIKIDFICKRESN
jgi:hypothetical protein